MKKFITFLNKKGVSKLTLADENEKKEPQFIEKEHINDAIDGLIEY
jgi:hypothetical protein